MWKKIKEKCLNYETISYLVCGVLTTAVDFVVYSLARKAGISVEVSQAVSFVAAVAFAYVVNKLIVFRNFCFRPGYLAREAASFVAARIVSGVLTWVMMVGLVHIGGGRGFLYEICCKAVVSVVNLVLNYVFSKLWIFKKEMEQS